MIAGELEIRLRADIARLQRDMDSARRVVGDATAGIERAAASAKAALAGIAAGVGVSQIVALTDQYTKFTAQLRLATDNARQYAQAYADVKRISTSAQADLGATGTLYARIANGTRELGLSQQKVASITETVNMALKVSGATAEESSSAMLQLSQAFASGRLNGEEFNAVNEAAPRLMAALAEGMGVPVGALKKMAEEGKITSQVMAETLPQSLDKLREEAKQVQTIGGAFTVLKNEVLEFTGVQAQSSGVVAALTSSITTLASNLNLVAGAAATVAAVKLGNWLTNTVSGAASAVTANRALAASNLETARATATSTAQASLLANARLAEVRAATLAAAGQTQLALTTNGLIPAQARAAAAAEAHALAMGQLAIAQRAASLSTTAVSGVIAALGGPIGAVITVLGIAATAWSWYQNKQDEANRKAAENTEQSTGEIVASLEKGNAKLRERIELAKKAGMGEVAKSDSAEVQRLAELSGRMDKLRGSTKPTDQLELINLQEIYSGLEREVNIRKQLKGELDATGSAAADVLAVRQRLSGVNKQYLEDLEKLQSAREKGAVTEQEYVAMVSQLATEEYKRSEAAKAAAASTKDGNKAIEEQAKLAAELAGLSSSFAADWESLTAMYKRGALSVDQLTEAQARLLEKQPAIKANMDAEAKAFKDATRAVEEMNAERAKMEGERAEAARREIKAAEDELAANENAVAMFGKTKAAIEAVELARLEEQLAQRSSVGMTLDEIEKLEKLIDVKRRNVAALGTSEVQEASKKAFDQMTEDAKQFARQTGDALVDNIMRGGKSAAEYLKDLFRTLILRPILSPVGTAFGGVTAGLMGGAGPAQAAGGGGIGSALGSMAGSLFGAGGLSGSIAAGAGWLTGATTLGGSLAAAGSLAATGTLGGIASSLGMAAGALGPIALGIAAVVGVLKKFDTSGTYHTGGASSASAAGVQTIRAESLGFARTRTNAETEAMTAGLAKGIVSILDSTATAFGKTAGYTAATAFADDTSKDGAWGALLIQKMGQTMVNWDSTRTSRWAPKEFANGDAGRNEYLAALSSSVRTALDGIGLPSWARKMLDSLGAQAGLEEMAKVVDTINATQGALRAIGDELAGFSDLSDAAVSALMAASGGIEALAGNAGAFVESFYSESEKLDAATKQVRESLAAVGLALPETREQYRAMVEQQIKLGEAGAPAVAVLLGNAAAFAQLRPAVEAATQALDKQADVLRERQTLQDQLDDLTMTAAQLLEKQRNALDESNRALFDRIQSEKAMREAISAAQAAADRTIADAKAALSVSYNAESSALQALAESHQNFVNSVRKNSEAMKLGALSILSPEARLQEARSQMETAGAGEFMAAQAAFLQEAKSFYGSTEGYSREYKFAEESAARAVARDAARAESTAYWLRIQFALLNKSAQAVVGVDGSHASGLDFVPFDGYRAELHRGERVQTAAEARADDRASEDTAQLLRDIHQELRAANGQRGAVGVAQIDRLERLEKRMAATERKLARAE